MEILSLETSSLWALSNYFLFLKKLIGFGRKVSNAFSFVALSGGYCFNGPPNLFGCLHFRFYPVMIVAMVQRILFFSAFLGCFHTMPEKFENSTVRPTVHTNPSRQRSFSKMLFKPEQFGNAGFFVFVWTKNILKPLQNDDVTTIM